MHELMPWTSQHCMRANRWLTYINTADIFKLTVVLCISVCTNLLFSLMRYLLSNRLNLGYSTQLFVSPSHFSLDNFVMLTDSLTGLWITGSSCGKDWQRDGNRECVCLEEWSYSLLESEMGKRRKNREGEPSSPAFLWVLWLSLTTNVNPYPCATVVNLHEELVVYFSSTPQWTD